MGRVWISGGSNHAARFRPLVLYFKRRHRPSALRHVPQQQPPRDVSSSTWPAGAGARHITLYERAATARSSSSMQPAGENLLSRSMNSLRLRFRKRGCSTSSIKSPLPSPAHCVGVITSKTGAALHDILHVLKRRDPALPVIIPTRPLFRVTMHRGQIVRAIELANASGVRR